MWEDSTLCTHFLICCLVCGHLLDGIDSTGGIHSKAFPLAVLYSLAPEATRDTLRFLFCLPVREDELLTNVAQHPPSLSTPQPTTRSSPGHLALPVLLPRLRVQVLPEGLVWGHEEGAGQAGAGRVHPVQTGL